VSTRPPAAKPARRLVAIESRDLERAVAGPVHSHLQLLEQAFADHGLRAESQGGGVLLTGDEEGVRRAADVIEAFMSRIQAGAEASAAELQATISLLKVSSAGAGGDAIAGLRKSVMAQTPGQRAYLETLRDEQAGLVFGIGPAGTGKTFLAVAVGAAALRAGRFERLVVARPAVEAGERLGFLPGDLEDKVDPYMLPIWDALNDCLGAAEVDRRKERKEIEVAPLAFMRGRTLKNAFVIIDEAQNATIPQMKMVLTRLGRGSRMAVTGDPSQTDLPERTQSGLAHALGILTGVKGVAVHHLTSADVVRHDLVGRIIEAYDRHAARPDRQDGS
jgi:phosphate starvation-inducible protein PhoH and related proteins